MPLYELKIDCSFIHDMPDYPNANTNGTAIVQSIIAMPAIWDCGLSPKVWRRKHRRASCPPMARLPCRAICSGGRRRWRNSSRCSTVSVVQYNRPVPGRR